jgi:hypothetical protein
MPSYTYQTDSTNNTYTLQSVLGVKERRKSYEITVYNTGQVTILVGREGVASIPLYSGLVYSFKFAIPADMAINSQGNSGILIVFDDSGPLDYGDFVVTVPIIKGNKAIIRGV